MEIKKYLERYAAWGILCVGAVLRFYQLGKRDFWYDEAFSANLIRHSGQALWSEITYDVHPPLYYLLLKAYTYLTGTGVIGLRSFSVLCGVISLGLVYLISRDLLSKRAALFATCLAAVSPFTIQYSQEVRMYALYGLWILLTVYCVLRAIRTEDETRHWHPLGWWIAGGVSFGLACLTHYMSFLLAPCLFLVWLVQRKKSSPLNGVAIGILAACLTFLPWMTVFLRQLRASQDVYNFHTPPVFQDLLMNLEIFLIGTPKGELSPWSQNPNLIASISTTALSQLILCGLVLISILLLKRSPKKTATLLILFIGPITCAYSLSLWQEYYFISRYLFPTSFFLCILLGYGLSTLKTRYAAIGVSSYLILLLLIQPANNSEGYNQFLLHLNEYPTAHFYSLNTFDYMLAKYYVGPDRLTLYNVGWPQYDSRPWPGIGYQTKRTEHFDDLKNDSQGIVIWNVQFPLNQRDDKAFDTTDFQRIAKYKTIELYRPKKFTNQPSH